MRWEWKEGIERCLVDTAVAVDFNRRRVYNVSHIRYWVEIIYAKKGGTFREKY